MKDILVTIKDAHIVDGEREQYEMMTRGIWDGDENNYTIEYEEVYDEMKGCRTLITVENKRCVSIVRSGTYNHEITVELDKQHTCEYNTPFGSIFLNIYAQEIHSAIVDGKGTLQLKYSINFYGGNASINEMIITLE